MPDSLIEALDRSAAAAQRSRSAEVRVLLLSALAGGAPVAPTTPRPAAAPDAPALCGGCRTGKHYTCDNRDARFRGTCSCATCLADIEKDRAEQEAWALVLTSGTLPPARTRRVPRPVYETGMCFECMAGCHSSCCLKADDYSPESGVIICSCGCVGWSLEQKRKEWLLPYDEVGVEAGICDPCSRGDCTQCDWHRKRGLCLCDRCKDSGALAGAVRFDGCGLPPTATQENEEGRMIVTEACPKCAYSMATERRLYSTSELTCLKCGSVWYMERSGG